MYVWFCLPQEIAMTTVEEELRVRVGSSEWRDLRVRQYEITQTTPDAELPDCFHLSEEVAAKISPEDDEEVGENSKVEEIDAMFAEGGKFAYQDACSEEATDSDENNVLSDEENLPEWIVCFKSSKFFTMTQALTHPAPMQIRAWDSYIHTFMYILMYTYIHTYIHM